MKAYTKIETTIAWTVTALIAVGIIGLGYVVGDTVAEVYGRGIVDTWIFRIIGIGCGLHLAYCRLIRDNRTPEEKAADKQKKDLDRLYGRDVEE